MKLWLDDVRPLPEGFDMQVQTAEAAIALLATGQVQSISLDHDLGAAEAGTGYDVALYIEAAAYQGTLPPLRWALHSANPVGVRAMRIALQNADQYWGAKVWLDSAIKNS